jgi:hypothetical protein
MTDRLSRREMVVLAGAGLATLQLGGRALARPSTSRGLLDQYLLSPGNKALSAASPAEVESFFEIKKALADYSGGDYWGRDPHDITPNNPAKWRKFEPSYIVILYLKFEDLGLSVNHAAFSVPVGNTDVTRREKAVKILKEKGTKNLGHIDLQVYGTHPHQLHNAHHQQQNGYDSTWFDDFNFASQNELFIYIDNNNINLEPGDLIEFKPFGIGDDVKHPNYSYFHALEVTGTDLDGSNLRHFAGLFGVMS